jgi:hypothetical protein
VSAEHVARRTRPGRARFLPALAALAAFAAVATAALTIAKPSVNALPSPLPRQAGCAVATEADSLCIVVLGDSIGVGVPVEGDDRWWPRLRRLLEADLPGRTIQIDNWAVSGSQVDVLESVARDQPELPTYDIAIVVEGVNDLVARSVEAWGPRYEAAVTAIEARDVTVIVTTPPPSFENGAFGSRYDGLAAAVRAMAGPHRLLLDLATRWRADGPAIAAAYYVDSIHQALPGQIVMAALARDAVLKAIGAR